MRSGQSSIFLAVSKFQRKFSQGHLPASAKVQHTFLHVRLLSELMLAGLQSLESGRAKFPLLGSISVDRSKGVSGGIVG